MDTPEVIWGCLDAGSHLEAAHRLLRVQEVHQQLQDAFAHIVAAKFPVLSHQWQTVLKFRYAHHSNGCRDSSPMPVLPRMHTTMRCCCLTTEMVLAPSLAIGTVCWPSVAPIRCSVCCGVYVFRQHILAGAVSVLSGQQGLSSRAAADALAAVAVLEGHDSAAALQAFLSARQQWVQQQLEQAAQGQAGEAPGEVLAALAQTVQSCVAQVSPALGNFLVRSGNGLNR